VVAFEATLTCTQSDMSSTYLIQNKNKITNRCDKIYKALTKLSSPLLLHLVQNDKWRNFINNIAQNMLKMQFPTKKTAQTNTKTDSD